MARNFVRASLQYGKSSATPVTTTPVTVACWVKPASFSTAVACMAISQAAGLNAYLLYVTAAGVLNAYAQDPGASSAGTAGILSTGVWAHVGGVFTSTTSRTAYLNGVAGVADTVSISPTSFDHASVGVWQQTSGLFFYMDGDIAEAAVWNIALTAGDMAALAKGVSPLFVRPDALVSYWPLMGQYSPEIDVMVSNKALTLTNTPIAAVHPRVFLKSRKGRF